MSQLESDEETDAINKWRSLDLDPEYIRDRNELLAEINKKGKGLLKAYKTRDVTLDDEATVRGWVHGLIESIGKYNSLSQSYKNTYPAASVDYAKLTQNVGKANEYEIKYGNDYYLYETIRDKPYFKRTGTVPGGKRIR